MRYLTVIEQMFEKIAIVGHATSDAVALLAWHPVNVTERPQSETAFYYSLRSNSDPCSSARGSDASQRSALTLERSV